MLPVARDTRVNLAEDPPSVTSWRDERIPEGRNARRTRVRRRDDRRVADRNPRKNRCAGRFAERYWDETRIGRASSDALVRIRPGTVGPSFATIATIRVLFPRICVFTRFAAGSTCGLDFPFPGSPAFPPPPAAAAPLPSRRRRRNPRSRDPPAPATPPPVVPRPFAAARPFRTRLCTRRRKNTPP